MSESRFARLKDSPQFGEYLRALDERPLTGAQLSRNATQIKTQLAAGAAGTALLTTETLLKVGLPLLIASGLVGAYLAISTPTGQPQQTDPAISQQHPQAAEPVEFEAVAPFDSPKTSEPPKAEKSAQPTKPQRPKSYKQRAPKSKAAPSILPEQLALYDDARVAAARGQHNKAVKLMGRLLDEYPATPLRAEAELSRLEYLSLLGAYKKAIFELNRLLPKPEHAGRSGELLRLLGDLHRKNGDCEGARDAYTKASSQPLNTPERTAVTEGLRLCPTK